MKVGGRMESSFTLSEKECHPVILPRHAHVTKVIIEYVHRKINHGGRSITLSELRVQGYYVQNGSKVVAQMLRNCVTCRKIRRPTEIQYISEQFWGKWKREYLLNLQERQKWATAQRNIKVGDVVLLVEETTPRCHWPLGLVTKAEPDQDSLVRKVSLRISNIKMVSKGNKQKEISTLERPVQKLVLLLPSPDS